MDHASERCFQAIGTNTENIEITQQPKQAESEDVENIQTPEKITVK